MPSLADLPGELRDYIWALVCQHDRSHPYSAYDLLRTCKQTRRELAPYLYDSIVFHLNRPYQALHWIYRIGSFNGSCIHRLVLRFSSIQTSQTRDNASDIWSASFQCLPNLQRLTYEYDPHQSYHQCRSARLDDHPVLKRSFLDHLPMFISPNSTKTNADDHIDYNDILSSESKIRKRPITHAVLAVDEPMPEILILPYKKHLQLNPTISLEQNITGVFPSVFRQRGLRPTHTYAFVETPEKPFVSLTYTKPPGASAKIPLVKYTEIPNLRVMLSNLPQLIYLRVGCPSTNSSFLPFIPPTIQTLDVAITDSDPARVASNLWSMRHHCPQLFTLAIAISPLHDNNQLPDGGRPIDQSSGIGELGEWEPFWEALRGIQATGVRVWEGEGPGFRNVSRRDNVN